MKSRTSYFNPTVFRKNLTRFAPCWGLYTVGAIMGLVLLLDSGSKYMAPNLVDSVHVLCLVTPIYALICAQLLFGDLYNSRMCNALHALPLRRETWFVTNVISGLVFHLIPTTVLSVLAAPVLAVYAPENAVLAAPIFLLGTNLQFLCFFGLAVFSGFCVGSRFAQGVIYGILNFGSVIVGWLLDTLYIPQFYGIRLNYVPFFLFSPIAQMAESPFADTVWNYREVSTSVTSFVFALTENTAYYFIVAAVGIGLLAAALGLYRCRKLECAGDFLAIPALAPAFLLIYSLVAGGAFYFLTDDIFGMGTPVFLFVGLAVGWFTGKMLLERTPRVFRVKNCLQGGALMAAVGLTLVIAAWDPLGLESWIPEAEDVESVTIADGWYSPMNEPNGLRLEDPEDIRRIIEIHRETLADYRGGIRHEATFQDAYKELILETEVRDSGDFSSTMTFTYHMKNGRTVHRYYDVWMGGDTGEYLLRLFSSPEAVFGVGVTEEEFLSLNSYLVLRDTWEGQEWSVNDREEIRSLYRAILADCRVGTMAQQWDFHRSDQSIYWINVSGGPSITVYSDAENTLQWLREHGMDVDEILEKYGY